VTVQQPAVQAPAAALPQGSRTLRIATTGGAYGDAQRIAVFEPFTKDTGIAVDALHDNLATNWDVADLSPAQVAEGCSKGLLEQVDPAALKAAPDGTPAAQDYLPGGLSPCGIASLAWSAVILTMGEQKDAKTGKALAQIGSLKNFFDVVKFPGKRGLPHQPEYVLELALMADGVAPDDIYKQLATPEGLNRALNRLSTIRSQIVWWSSPQDAIEGLKTKSVVATVAFSGRAFMEIATTTKPIKIIWDGQIYDLDVWSVSKGSHDKADAMKFVAYATSPDRLAETARQLPYGPMRKSAIALVGTHAVLSTDLKPFLPTETSNFATALRFDGQWWKAHANELNAKLDDWIENPPWKSGVGKDSNGFGGKAPG
jgi:putative spermidine/putrescine transport system substrate-binding protein